jgi:predicted PurR-regulated permease PerM
MYNMEEKRMLKRSILLITYAIVLYLALINLHQLSGTIRYLLNVTFPVVAGFAVAYVLNLPMSAIERGIVSPFLIKIFKKEKPASARGLSMMLIFLLLFAVIGGMIFFIVPDVVENAKTLGQAVPGHIDRMGAAFMTYLSSLNIPQTVIDQLKNYADTVVSTIGEYAVNLIPQMVNGIGQAASRVTGVILCVIVAVYLLAGKESLYRVGRSLMAAYVPRKPREEIYHVLDVADDCFSRYITGQVSEAFILGALCFIGMSLFRFPYPLLIGLLVGIGGLIPMFGAIIGAGLGAFLILVVSPGKVIWFILFIIVLQQIEGNFIYPRVVGSSMGLKGIYVVLAIIIGGNLLGFFGMVVGIPLFATLYTLIRRDVIKRTHVEKGKEESGKA